MIMKRMFLLFCALLGAFTLYAQEIIVPEGYELVDSLVYRQTDTYESALVGKDVFDIPNATVRQNATVAAAMKNQIENNKHRTLNGYRIRIFFDNKQNSRVVSEETLSRFNALYPGVAAYRSYANPYFKVTVGNFRTKSEAMAMLEKIKQNFPSAFVIKENIDYPVVDKTRSYVIDTVKVLRPLAVSL